MAGACSLRFRQDASVSGPSNQSAEERGSRGGCGSETEKTTGTDTTSLPRPSLPSTGESCTCTYMHNYECVCVCVCVCACV